MTSSCEAQQEALLICADLSHPVWLSGVLGVVGDDDYADPPFLAVLTSLFGSKTCLEAENVAFRWQVIVSQRKLRGRVRLSNKDRWFSVWLGRLFPSALRAVLIFQPETILRWEWRWVSPILEMEIGRSSRPASGRRRASCIDSADER